MATTCAPCIFGAFSSLVSFPIDIATVSAVVQTVVSIGNDTIPTTSVITSTIAPTTTVNTPNGNVPVTTITYTNVDQLTFTVPGVPGLTLTYPTTYADYTSFQGAAVTGTGCATSLVPTALNTAGIPQASLIYPAQYNGALPSGLVSYLDSQAGFIRQLNNDKLEQCAGINGAVAASGGASSVVLTLTSTLPTTSVVTSTIPPPTTFTSSGSVTTVLTETTPGTAAITQSTGLFVSTISLPNTIYISGGQTTHVTAQSAVLGSSTVDLSSVLSALSSKSSAARASSSGIYTNITSTVTSTYRSTISVPASRTSSASLASYTGAAVPVKMDGLTSFVAALLGFVFYL